MVELEHVTVRYGSQEETDPQQEESLHDFSLHVRKGEFILLTGPSGCGKTTALRLVNGLVPRFYPAQVNGRIRIGKKEIGDDEELYSIAHTVSTVFQNPRTQFYNVDTTSELAFGCENRGLAQEEICQRIDRTVSDFGIERLMDRSIFRLSDGEKQKIACAGVDVSATDVILLDEPSANLDFESTMALRKLLIRWKKQGKTILAAEHRIGYLWDLTDRVMIMRDGRIIRTLEGSEKDGITQEECTKLGLRSLETEDAFAIRLPAVCSGDEVIRLEDFRFSYRGEKRKIVDIPKLEIAKNEITAVTGENGAGKTSFLNCLCGIEKKCRGTMYVEGNACGSKERRKLCFMVMQDTGNQLFTESVLDEVMISLPKKTRNEKERALEILREVDLEAFCDRHPQSLSGGQKQRLAIACAFASDRKILLFDEPTSGLDHLHMMQTAEMLKKLKKRGTTVLVVTHDSELVQACCTRKIQI